MSFCCDYSHECHLQRGRSMVFLIDHHHFVSNHPPEANRVLECMSLSSYFCVQMTPFNSVFIAWQFLPFLVAILCLNMFSSMPHPQGGAVSKPRWCNHLLYNYFSSFFFTKFSRSQLDFGLSQIDYELSEGHICQFLLPHNVDDLHIGQIDTSMDKKISLNHVHC